MLENSPDIEFPTSTLCLLLPTKLSVTKSYEFQNDNEKFFKEIPNSTLHQRLDELNYQLNKDFEIRSFYGEDKMKISLQNIQETFTIFFSKATFLSYPSSTNLSAFLQKCSEKSMLRLFKGQKAGRAF